MPSKEWFKSEAEKKIVEGNIFDFDNPVITCMTGGRAYGSISKEVMKRGVKIPELEYGKAKFVAPYIFIAMWDDESQHTDLFLSDCGAAIMSIAAGAGLEKVHMPFMGGRKDCLDKLAAVEKGAFEMGDHLDDGGFIVPEHAYVTDKSIT